MEREAAAARYERIHKDAPWHNGSFTSWAKEPDDGHPYRYDMGVNIWVAPTDLNPDDRFLSGTDAPPDASIPDPSN